MSKTLALIVTATVLMITAAIVVFMGQGGLSDVLTGSNQNSCVSQARAECKFISSQPAVPNACDEYFESNSGPLSFGNGGTINPDSVDCPGPEPGQEDDLPGSDGGDGGNGEQDNQDGQNGENGDQDPENQDN